MLNTSPSPAEGNTMIQVKVSTNFNTLLNEKIATARIVNMQSMDFEDFVNHLCDGSTITPGDCAAVMKRLEAVLPRLMALNVRVNVSPNGMYFAPTVTGSITQSKLKEVLETRRKNYIKAGNTEAAGKIDVDRDVLPSDLPTTALTAGITVTLPKKMLGEFDSKVVFKRLSTDACEDEDNNGTGTDNTGNDSDNTGSGSGNRTYTVNITSASTSQGTVDTSVNGTHAEGSRIILRATPQSGFAFDKWSDGDTSNPRNVTVNADLTLQAQFRSSTGGSINDFPEGL